MFSSIRFRLWLTYILVVGVVLTISGITVAIFLLRSPTQDRRELQRLRLVANLVSQRGQLLNNGLSPNSPRLEELVNRSDKIGAARFAIFSAAGELLADSRSDSAAPLPEWAYFAASKPRQESTFRDSRNRLWLYVLTPLEGGAVMLTATPRPRIAVFEILRDEFLTPFVRGAFLALALTIIFSIWIAHWISAPLQRLEKATQRISGVSFQKYPRIPLEGPREVQAVADSFNKMGERVHAAQRSQSDFIANVSHDLKTPLTSIQGFAQAILDGAAADTTSVQQAAQVIFDEAGRMNRLVLELLDLARMEAGTFGFEHIPVDLVDLLSNVVEKFTPQARQAQVDLRLDIAAQGDAHPSIIADPDRLAQVFTNLIDNALKYSPPGGLVSVSVRPVEKWAEVQVSDTGLGIPPAELGRIFERFYQTDKARSGGNTRGLGLGLTIAREIIQAHGGVISAYNRSQIDLPAKAESTHASSGTGSIFVVRLPLTGPVAESHRADDTIARKRKETAFRSPGGD